MSPTPEEPFLKLGQLRLLLALDTLLIEGSVSRAAERMGMSTPAMSRLLGQIREIYDDPIFIRASRRLIPTSFAESLRPRVRALAAAAEALLQKEPLERSATSVEDSSWLSPPVIEPAPLSMRPSILLEGEPLPDAFVRKLAALEHTRDTRKRLARHIATIAAGLGHSRPLTMDEATDAFSIILDGKADPVQVGALLSVMHFRGETAAELAGLVRASREHIHASASDTPAVDLDWPAYVSPKSRRMPWFLQAALLVAQAGHRVLLHGADGSGHARGMLVSAAQAIGVPVCTSIEAAANAIAEHGIAYLPVGAISPQIYRLLSLYGLLETRSPVNSLVPLLNPLSASSCIAGVVRPVYRELHRDAGRLLGYTNLTILGASRDAAEATPFRSSTLYRLVHGHSEDLFVPATPEPKTHPLTGMTSLEYWQAVWTGAARDERARDIIVATTGAALLTLAGDDASKWDMHQMRAAELWDSRRKSAS